MSSLKKLFKNLQTDSESVLVTAEKINDRVLKKLKKSLYKKHKEVVNLFNSNVDFLDHEQKNIPIKTRFVEKKMILTDQPCAVLTVHFSCCMLKRFRQICCRLKILSLLCWPFYIEGLHILDEIQEIHCK